MHTLEMPLNFNLAQSYIPCIVIAMGIITAINVANHCFSISVTQNIAADTPPGTLVMHTISVFHPNILPPLNENIALCAELLTVEHAEPILNLIQFDAIQNDLPMF